MKIKKIIGALIGTTLAFCAVPFIMCQQTPNVTVSQEAPAIPALLSTQIALPGSSPDATVQIPTLQAPPDAGLKVEASPVVTQKPIGELQEIKEIKGDSKEIGDIFLNFESASLLSVVNYLAEQKKINIIPHKELDAAKVSLSTRQPLTLERAWNVLLTLLEMNGFSIIKVGNLYRVVQSKDNGLEPLPTYSSETGTQPEDLPDSDMIVRYLYFFKNIKPDMAQNILKTMIDPNGVIINVDLMVCIIKEQCFNIKAAMRILKELDRGGLREQIKIMPLRYVNAKDVKELFDKIIEPDKGDKVIRLSSQKESTYFSSSTKIFPEQVKNQLILLGNETSLDRIIDFIYKYIDVPFGDAVSRLHIKEIRYAKAEVLKGILDVITQPPKGQASEKSILVGEYKFFEDVIITAEKSGDDSGTGSTGNRLIIACNRDDWKRLDALVDKLDKPQPQVAFEIMIVNVTADQDKQLGAQMFGILGRSGKKLGLGIHEVEFKNLSPGTVPTTSTDKKEVQNYIDLAGNKMEGKDGSPTFITLGKAATATNAPENIWSIIKARYSINNNNVISQPFIVANNNKECVVESNFTKRIPGKLISNTVGPVRQEKEDKTAKTMVKIKPRVNLSGYVDLDINVTVDEFEEAAEGQFPVNNRSIDTQARMMSGEVLVLGGLTKSKLTESTWKTPILGDIPLLGNLFKNKTRKRTEENLYIFIRPSIIKPRFEGGADEYSQLKLDYAKYQIMKNDEYVKDRKDPIQRWFFKPSHQSVKQKLSDWSHGEFRPIDDYAQSKYMPREVNIKEDPYFRESEVLAASKAARDKLKKLKKEGSEKQPEVSTIHLS